MPLVQEEKEKERATETSIRWITFQTGGERQVDETLKDFSNNCNNCNHLLPSQKSISAIVTGTITKLTSLTIIDPANVIAII